MNILEQRFMETVPFDMRTIANCLKDITKELRELNKMLKDCIDKSNA